MYDVSYEELLGRIEDILKDSYDLITNDIAVLEEAILKSEESNDEPTLHVWACEVTFDTALAALRADQDLIKDAMEAAGDILDGYCDSSVIRLAIDYLQRIQQKYEMDPDDRIEVRMIDAEIRKIEKALEEKGYPIFGGFDAYVDMMEEPGDDDEGGCDCERVEED